MNSLPEGAIGGDGVMLSITPSFFPEGAKSQMAVWDLNPWNVILFSWTLIDRSVLSSSLSFWKTPWVTYASFWGKLIWFVILHLQSMCHSTDHFLDQQVMTLITCLSIFFSYLLHQSSLENSTRQLLAISSPHTCSGKAETKCSL